MFVYSGWLDLLSVLCDHYQAYFSVLLRFSKIALTLSNLFPLLRHDPSGVSSKCYIWSLKAVWSGVARNNSQPFVTSDNSSALRWSLYSITWWSLTLCMSNLVFNKDSREYKLLKLFCWLFSSLQNTISPPPAISMNSDLCLLNLGRLAYFTDLLYCPMAQNVPPGMKPGQLKGLPNFSFSQHHSPVLFLLSEKS